jgi:hypothetical protein
MNDHPAPARAAAPTRLIAANAALLGLLAVLTIAGMQSPAGAQSGVQRSRGEYTLVSGRYQGGTASAVYVVDSANQEVLALIWNRTKNEFEPLGMRSMLADGQRQAPPR